MAGLRIITKPSATNIKKSFETLGFAILEEETNCLGKYYRVVVEGGKSISFNNLLIDFQQNFNFQVNLHNISFIYLELVKSSLAYKIVLKDKSHLFGSVRV